MKSPTRNDVAKIAKVSPTTVSRALSGSPLIPEKTAARIRKIALQLGYSPNILASRFALKRSFQIAFAIEFNGGRVRKGPIQLGYYSGILDGIISSAYPEKYSVLIKPYKEESEIEALNLIKSWLSREIDGIIFASLERNSVMIPVLTKSKMPFVIIGSLYKNLPSLTIDFYEPYLSIMKLIKSKHKQSFIFLAGDKRYEYAIRQEKSLKQAAKKMKLKISAILEGDYSWKCGYSLAPEIIKKEGKNGVAIFANDRMAAGFYRYCYEQNIKIPYDISVVGADKDPVADGLYPSLTTIVQPRLKMGKEAFFLLKECIENKEQQNRKNLIISQEVLLRESL
ncbi:MAG TPA: LacI family DNA-binding transcriptional regulator [Victivallales bacterium]|nr:LacI family DNA-binding transcriptional regulator [Victivallales bacterium]HPO90617.1 LacI family DNA-binding transcriptional regulator [Victivallales bacterium]HRR28621.1 LacI family DNA-binding transcriptional regulator [Victivallales bacterium]HRU00765.1 LacI family DNA-binding transcriptional regulator [Victivallales bacterium]